MAEIKPCYDGGTCRNEALVEDLEAEVQEQQQVLDYRQARIEDLQKQVQWLGTELGRVRDDLKMMISEGLVIEYYDFGRVDDLLRRTDGQG